MLQPNIQSTQSIELLMYLLLLEGNLAGMTFVRLEMLAYLNNRAASVYTVYLVESIHLLTEEYSLLLINTLS